MHILTLSLGAFAEYFVIFMLLLSIFNFGIREFFAEVMFSCLLLVFVSISLSEGFHLDDVAPFIQLLGFILVLWGVFQFNIFSSFLMGSVYVGYGFLQAIYLKTLELIGLATLEQVQAGGVSFYVLQISSIVLTLLIAFVISRFFSGFNVVHQGRSNRFSLSKINLILLAASVSLIWIFGVSYFLMMNKGGKSEIYTFLIFAALNIVVFIYLLKRKQRG
ncbi:hypothetical protein [Brevibacillus laterosporus]|uniref:Uncharacterized protein n=1 Tax=Brevibacillus laterosporus TaxID=1465 RepID=A0AAP3DJ08_BRELA|nr:hypothetical protein [Brevibacillus laterosporus]MCR8981596.1 hypothetical protein [Brevibacillus laterosporus]MCZ0808751.1 hypothetical protein [Brevibacillus laterosporus]MCZ0827276.1 hypothetical protein [Brevibacillus laterosporus]MCZ0851032.1 hypothetical protein [Brevibacillus laterosporus]